MAAAWAEVVQGGLVAAKMVAAEVAVGMVVEVRAAAATVEGRGEGGGWQVRPLVRVEGLLAAEATEAVVMATPMAAAAMERAVMVAAVTEREAGAMATEAGAMATEAGAMATAVGKKALATRLRTKPCMRHSQMW
jgi:hypothetical protein